MLRFLSETWDESKLDNEPLSGIHKWLYQEMERSWDITAKFETKSGKIQQFCSRKAGKSGW